MTAIAEFLRTLHLDAEKIQYLEVNLLSKDGQRSLGVSVWFGQIKVRMVDGVEVRCEWPENADQMRKIGRWLDMGEQ